VVYHHIVALKMAVQLWVVGGLGCRVKIYCSSTLLMMIDIRQPEWVGCVLAFLALCKVGFVSGFCVPCNVLKIAWGRVGKVMDALYV